MNLRNERMRWMGLQTVGLLAALAGCEGDEDDARPVHAARVAEVALDAGAGADAAVPEDASVSASCLVLGAIYYDVAQARLFASVIQGARVCAHLDGQGRAVQWTVIVEPTCPCERIGLAAE
ncbi:MAG: hypothetical protein ABW252_18435 [Polyangiales bacterium]